MIIKDAIADITLQQVLTRPEDFDVIATMNLNGDYISDALAAQVGGLAAGSREALRLEGPFGLHPRLAPLADAWREFEDALIWQPLVPLFCVFGFCWQRTWDRPFVPDLEAGNMLAKQLQYLAGADAAGIVLGARVPIVLTSRADPIENKLLSIATAVYLADVERHARLKIGKVHTKAPRNQQPAAHLPLPCFRSFHL